MRSSTVVTLLCAGLAIASPLHKKAIVYDIVTTDIVYVTVTDGEEPATSASPFDHYHHVHTSSATPTTSVDTPSAPAVLLYITPAAATSSPEPAYIPEPSTTQTPVLAVASTSVEAPAASPTDFQSTALYHHNVHRANNSVSDLTWDSTMAEYAATVAASCVYAHDLTPGGGGYGQNIAVYGSSGDADANTSSMIAMAATDMWYNGEVNLFLPSYYGEANPDFSNFEKWGHYTQMVWKSTTGVGCAVQCCAAGTIFPSMQSWFSVCNYNPPGNMGGAYGTNVLKPLGQETVTS